MGEHLHATKDPVDYPFQYLERKYYSLLSVTFPLRCGGMPSLLPLSFFPHFFSPGYEP